jgi:TRAP-type C4-dicarboxylate transport system permease small subunit
MLLKIEAGLGKFTWAISLISYAGVIAITLLNVADVVINKTMSKHIDGTYELTEQMLYCTVLASFAYGQSKKAHINMTMIIKHLPTWLKFPIFGFMGLLSSITCAVTGYATFQRIGVAYEGHLITEMLGIVKWPFVVVATICLFALAIVLLFDTIMAFVATKNKDIADHVMSTWSD